MTIPIKIECPCGQHYAFEAEPEDGRLPFPVSCPECGTDGTETANAIIARSLAPPPVSAEPPAAVPSGSGLRIGKLDPVQAEREARAKIIWGDQPAEVISHLMSHGIPAAEAAAKVETMLKERAAEVRAKGIRSVARGAALAIVPFIGYAILMGVFGVLPLKLFAPFVAVGVWGGWKLMNGAFMLLAPRLESGNVGED